MATAAAWSSGVAKRPRGIPDPVLLEAPAQRRLAHRVGVVVVADHRGVGRAGGDGVDPDPVLRPEASELLGGAVISTVASSFSRGPPWEMRASCPRRRSPALRPSAS